MNASNDSAAAEDAAVEFLREQVLMRQQRITDLHMQLAGLNAELKRYDKALRALTGEPGPGPGRPAGSRVVKRKQTPGQRVSEATVVRVEACVRELASERDEFRQVDVRSRIDVTSGVAALAFATLRDRGVIRVTRQEGNNKWFAMTRAALNGGDDGGS